MTEKHNKFGTGNAPSLTLEVEKEVVLWITSLVEKGFPACWLDVEIAAIQFAELRFNFKVI